MSDLFWDSTLGSILNWSFSWFAFHFVLIIVAALPSPSVPRSDLLQNPIWRVRWGFAACPGCAASARAGGDTFWGSAEVVQASGNVSSWVRT